MKVMLCCVIIKEKTEKCRMELLQLRYFCAAAACESFSETARRYGVPPSDISQSVKRLESELGVQLFTRRPSRILLNENGKSFYARATAALEMLDGAVTELTSGGRVRICINVNRRIAEQAIDRYRRLYPEVELIVTHLTAPDISRYDVIIDDADGGLPAATGIFLAEEEILLAVPSDSPYARAGAFTPKDLKDAPFITLGEHSSLFRMTHAICQAHGVTPRIALQSDDPFYVRRSVELGLGVTLSPAFSWQGQFSDAVTMLPLFGITRATYAYTAPTATACVERFCEILREEFARSNRHTY